MAVIARHKWDWDEVQAVMVLIDPLLFALAFWEEDLTIPKSRLDLPEKWRGRQVVSLEQRKMIYDGAVYRLLRDVMPQEASESSQKVAHRTSRKIGKTLFIESTLIQLALTCTSPGTTEGMFHTPRENHMAPVRNRLESKIVSIPLFRMMFLGFDAATGIMNWRTGWIWHFRIEGMSNTGTNMVGLRAYCMMGDEADYSQSAPYIEREQTALPGCAQLWGGVPRGVRGVFWQICNTIEGRSWSVHRYDIRANPLYHSQTAFADQIKGDWYSQRVQTQVLGRDGEEAVSSFPVIPVDSSLHYVVRKFTIKEYEKFKDGLQKFLDIDLAIAQGEDSDAWMIHMDYGYAPSPTQIGISFLKGGLWRLVCRIEIMRVDTTPMANIIATIDTKILPKRAALIVLDAHGQGRGVLSALHTGEAWDQENYVNRAIPVGFEGSTPVPNVKVHRKCKQPVRQENDGYWSCDTCHNRIFDERELADAMRQTKSYLTDVLKEDFANGARLLNSAGKDWPGGIAVAIGDDAEVVEELAGTTEIQSQGGSTRYITPKDQDHMTDMLRCLASGAERYVSLMTDWSEFNPNDFGWGDGMFESNRWNAPWGTFGYSE